MGPGRGNGRWRPLLDGADKQRAGEAVERIARALSACDSSVSAVSAGTAGWAIFHAYRARSGGDPTDIEAAADYLDAAVDAVAEEVASPSLYSGFTGVAWALTHLADLDVAADPDDDPCEGVDGALRDMLSTSPWTAEYDLIGGLAGFGVYGLERLPRPSGRDCLELVIDRLAELARPAPDGVTWWTPPELLPELELADFPDGYYNVGLAHGVPAVIALLARACAAEVSEATARPLLDEAVAWLLGQQLPAGGGSFFPSFVAAGRSSGSSRVAWCYGDLGVAAALFCAARCVGVAEWEETARKIAVEAAQRPAERAGVVDAGLCHGAAGCGHIFNRFHQATGEPVFEEAARSWLLRALDFAEPGGGIAGFSAVRRADDGSLYRDPDAGLLTGAAGVGLALLAATTEVEPEWDRMLLVSAPEIDTAAKPRS